MNTLESINFQHYANPDPDPKSKSSLESLAKRDYLSHKVNWLLPQLLAYFGSFSLGNSKDLRIVARTNLGTDPRKIGMWRIVTKLPRSDLITKQNKNPEYSTLVPLFLAAFKKHQGIPYEYWDKEGVSALMEDKLYEAASYPVDPKVYSPQFRDRLLEIRNQGLEIMSGSKQGDMRDPITTWKLYRTADTELAGYPALTCTMLSQIWVAHPSLRNKYMILDPSNWDNMPEPLISDDIMDSNTNSTNRNTNRNDSTNHINRNDLGSNSLQLELPWL